MLKKKDLDNILKKSNKKITSNKTKHVLVKNELNELSREVETISRKRLTKDLINGYKILIGAKYFSSRIFEDYLVFLPAKKYIKYYKDLILAQNFHLQMNQWGKKCC